MKKTTNNSGEFSVRESRIVYWAKRSGRHVTGAEVPRVRQCNQHLAFIPELADKRQAKQDTMIFFPLVYLEIGVLRTFYSGIKNMFSLKNRAGPNILHINKLIPNLPVSIPIFFYSQSVIMLFLANAVCYLGFHLGSRLI